MGLLIKNVFYNIDEISILKDISLNIDKGMLGIIGPSGAGKTTLLRLISGYNKPNAGEVLLDDVLIQDIDVKKRAIKMALVPQNYAMEYDFTVLETVLMGRNPHKKLFEADTVADIKLARQCIKKAGIEELEKRSIIGLSGGEWQRMIIARALCQQSNILLMDEPVSSLDIKHQVGILDMVRELVVNNGLICVCVLHDLNLALNYCDNIALLKKGELYAYGSTKEVLTKEIIEDVYDTQVNIITKDETTFILPVMNNPATN